MLVVQCTSGYQDS